MTGRRRVPRLAALALALVVAGVTVPLVGSWPAGSGAQAPGAVTVMAAGDISPAPAAAKDDDHATSQLILDADPTAVLALGDNQYDRGELAEYQSPTGYRASWGRLKAKTYPTPGNHEYLDPAGGAAGYFGYFGPGPAIPPGATTPSTWAPGTSSRSTPAAGTPAAPRVAGAPPRCGGCWPTCAATPGSARWPSGTTHGSPTREGTPTTPGPGTSGTRSTPPTPTWS